MNIFLIDFLEEIGLTVYRLEDESPGGRREQEAGCGKEQAQQSAPGFLTQSSSLFISDRRAHAPRLNHHHQLHFDPFRN